MIQPNIITLLSSKDSKSSTNNDTGNDDDCQETSRNTNHSSSTQTKNAGLSVTIANLAVIDLGTFNLGHKASILLTVAKSNITVSLVLVHLCRKDRSTICHWVFASNGRIAQVVSARISVDTGHVGVVATIGSIAEVVGANIVVIAFHSGVPGNMVASTEWIAEIVSASIVIIAVDWSVLTSSTCWIAPIFRASISIIAVNWSGNAISSGKFALYNVARNGCTCHSIAGTTLGGGNIGEDTSRGRIAGIRCTWFLIIADFGDNLATC